MATTPEIGLYVTPASDTTTDLIVWLQNIAGDSALSNMMLIDAAVGAVREWQDRKDATPITWGMLKNGLGGNISGTGG